MITVHPYNKNWPPLFEKEAARIRKHLGDICHQIHHIGSTAVPGLWAKEDIDILGVMESLDCIDTLKEAGYIFKGEYNIPNRFFYSKNTNESKVNLHVVEADHGFIDLNLCFRDYLRSHDDIRDQYTELKQTLVKNPPSHQKVNGAFYGYTLGKNDFIKNFWNVNRKH